MTFEDVTLPGTVPPALQAAYDALSPQRRAGVRAHLLGGTSSEWLADWMTRAGAPVGSRTIRRYRAWLEAEFIRFGRSV